MLDDQQPSWVNPTSSSTDEGASQQTTNNSSNDGKRKSASRSGRNRRKSSVPEQDMRRELIDLLGGDLHGEAVGEQGSAVDDAAQQTGHRSRFSLFSCAKRKKSGRKKSRKPRRSLLKCIFGSVCCWPSVDAVSEEASRLRSQRSRRPAFGLSSTSRDRTFTADIADPDRSKALARIYDGQINFSDKSRLFDVHPGFSDVDKTVSKNKHNAERFSGLILGCATLMLSVFCLTLSLEVPGILLPLSLWGMSTCLALLYANTQSLKGFYPMSAHVAVHSLRHQKAQWRHRFFHVMESHILFQSLMFLPAFVFFQDPFLLMSSSLSGSSYIGVSVGVALFFTAFLLVRPSKWLFESRNKSDSGSLVKARNLMNIISGDVSIFRKRNSGIKIDINRAVGKRRGSIDDSSLTGNDMGPSAQWFSGVYGVASSAISPLPAFAAGQSVPTERAEKNVAFELSEEGRHNKAVR
jgi:hypothetical protein